MTVVPGNESFKALAGGKQSGIELDFKPDLDGAQEPPIQHEHFPVISLSMEGAEICQHFIQRSPKTLKGHIRNVSDDDEAPENKEFKCVSCSLTEPHTNQESCH